MVNEFIKMRMMETSDETCFCKKKIMKRVSQNSVYEFWIYLIFILEGSNSHHIIFGLIYFRLMI